MRAAAHEIRCKLPDPVANTSFGCFNPGTGFSLENRYLRVFEPSDIALPGDVLRIAIPLVAFSAICAHQLVYPTPAVSFISFRKTRAQKGVHDNVIHCCAEHSQYDPAEVDAGLASLLDAVATRTGFTVTDHRLELRGLCERCG